MRVVHETRGPVMLSGSIQRGPSRAVFPKLVQVRAHVEDGMICSAHYELEKAPKPEETSSQALTSPAPHSQHNGRGAQHLGRAVGKLFYDDSYVLSSEVVGTRILLFKLYTFYMLLKNV